MVPPPVHHTDFGADFGQFFNRHILDHQRTCERHARQASPYQISPIAVGYPFEAVHELVKSAMLNGLTPTVNSMLVVGLVSLPGMMTGQILAGAEPTQAVRYQIVTMFFICAGSTLSCTLSAVLVVRRFFDERGRFVLNTKTAP